MLARPNYITIADNIEYEVDSILNRKNSKNGLMYLVQWKGYEKREATWQPITNLLHCIDSVKLYQKKLKQRTQTVERVQLNFSDHQDNLQSKRKKKRVFKDDLIFSKKSNLSIKDQAKNELNKKKMIGKGKKKIKKDIQTNRSKVNQDDQQQEGQELCIPISQQQQQQQKKAGVNKKDQQDEDLFMALIDQADKQNVNNRVEQHVQRNGMNQQPEPFYPSLNLSELSRQQDYKLTLQNLNPHLDENQIISSHKKQKKIQRVDIPLSTLHILQQNDPILCNPNTSINKLIKASEIWLAQLMQGQQIVGYVSVKTLQMRNADLYLDYLEGLRD